MKFYCGYESMASVLNFQAIDEKDLESHVPLVECLIIAIQAGSNSCSG